MLRLSFKLKIILAIVFFTLFVTSLERYFLYQNIISQFKKSKESKNTLLINTISPIISLNISLGLHESNVEYLQTILEQNSDIEFLELLDKNDNILYTFTKPANEKFTIINTSINLASKNFYDSLSEELVGKILIHFSNEEFNELQKINQKITLEVFALTLVLLLIFILFLNKKFQQLTQLSQQVLSYDPKQNNLNLAPSPRKDEIGVIQNAIVSMLEKITSYSKELDAINLSLEEKVHQRTADLKEANAKLQLLSTTDPLTGIANRRHFEQVFSDILGLSKRKQSQISVIMCDIDHFKVVNDTYGHQTGDKVLIAIAKTLQDSLKRNTDIVARYGGEEFIIAMYDTDNKGAEALAEEIQKKLNNLHFQEMPNKSVTMSFGISSCQVTHNSSSENIVKHADIALYKAKENGRNMIVSFNNIPN
jgi:diguanylate cyclase (GGDEF)-like protein